MGSRLNIQQTGCVGCYFMGCYGHGLAMWAARHFGGLTLRETGEALGGLDYAAVSIAIKRLERKAASETSLMQRMKQIGTMLNVET
jgi:hypothetical protein